MRGKVLDRIDAIIQSDLPRSEKARRIIKIFVKRRVLQTTLLKGYLIEAGYTREEARTLVDTLAARVIGKTFQDALAAVDTLQV